MASNLVADIYAPSKAELQGKADATNWVKHVRKEAGLKQAFMFGTHDSGAGIGKGACMNIEDQLANGVRFLDLHLATFENEIWVYHEGGRITLKQATIEIESFLANKENEKLILHLRESPNAPKPVEWGKVKKLFRKGIHNSCVHKAQAAKQFSQMKGSIILIAPQALEMDGNWGEDAIAHFETAAGVSTEEGLSKFLKEDSPSNGEPRPVWVECKSLEEPEMRRDKEIDAVKNYFVKNCGNYSINIVTFSAVDDNHFSGLKETLV